MKYVDWLFIFTFLYGIVMISILLILLNGCTRTKKMTEYEIDCKQCSVKVNRVLDSKEFEQGL